jgi:hypothetical protein
MDQALLDGPTSYTHGPIDPMVRQTAAELEAEEVHPFAGIARPSVDALLDRNAKWFEMGCAAGETDRELAWFAVVQASLLQAQTLERIADRLERPNWIVRLWRFLIWEPEGK